MLVNIGFNERIGHNEQHGSISGFDVRLVDRVGAEPSKIKGLRVVKNRFTTNLRQKW